MATPTPLDIGQVGEWPPEESYYWEEIEVDAVGKAGSCHRCGGWGHFARDCPTPPDGKGPKGKGKGKGEVHKVKGGAKAVGKGALPGKGGPGPAKGTKGGGKGLGYQGICWNCGVFWAQVRGMPAVRAYQRGC